MLVVAVVLALVCLFFMLIAIGLLGVAIVAGLRAGDTSPRSRNSRRTFRIR